MKNSYYLSSFFWGAISKITIAIVGFISIPLLLDHFGKDLYAILSLAIATNAYMILLDLGINTGSIKFFSQWINNKEFDLVEKVARTSISFYIIIGIINSIILLLIAFYSNSIFGLQESETIPFQRLVLLLSFFTVFNWAGSVFQQLLIADEKISFVQQVLIGKSILNVFLVFFTLKLDLSIIEYFLLFLLNNFFVTIINYLKCKKEKLINSFIPQFYWDNFKIVIKYSIAIFLISIFQVTASHSRPIILSMFSSSGVSIVAEYKIVEVFPLFIISLGGILSTIFLPKSSKVIANNDLKGKEDIAYTGTVYTSIIATLLCCPVILCSSDLISLYVGDQYLFLSKWLSLWVFVLLFYLHSTPTFSLILATGKTKKLVYSTAISCIVSLVVNILLSKKLGIGSAIIGYGIYLLIQMSFYYLYFYQKTLHLKSYKIFKSFIIPTLLGIIILAFILFINISIESIYLRIAVKSGLWMAIYLLCLFTFKIIKLPYLISLYKSKVN